MEKSILPRPNDMVTQSILIEESYIMSGTKVKIILADYNIPEVGYEPNVSFNEKNPIFTYILVHEPPQPRLLKQLGWDIESDDEYTKPMIASVPRYLSQKQEDGIKPTDYFELKINKYTKIYLDYDYEDRCKIFQVTNVSSNMFNPVFYFLKLVPWRNKIDEDPTPINDPNLARINKDGQFKHLMFDSSREDGTKVNY